MSYDDAMRAKAAAVEARKFLDGLTDDALRGKISLSLDLHFRNNTRQVMPYGLRRILGDRLKALLTREYLEACYGTLCRDLTDQQAQALTALDEQRKALLA